MRKKLVKKGLAGILTVSMLFGIIPVMGNTLVEVKAQAQAGSTTDISVFMASGAENTMTLTDGESEQSLSDSGKSMEIVTYTAKDGYYFPLGYGSELGADGNINGIIVGRIDDKTITVAGYPTADTEVSLPAASPVSERAGVVTDKKDINLGADILTTAYNEGNANRLERWSATNGAYLYFGRYNQSPVKYRVLEADGNRVFLDCDGVLYKQKFKENWQSASAAQLSGNQNEYAGSDIQKDINDKGFYNNVDMFQKLEKNLIARTALGAEGEHTVDSFSFKNYAAVDCVFLLSAKEVAGYYGKSLTSANKKAGFTNYWWLRSAINHENPYTAGCMNREGAIIKDRYVDDVTPGVSPAFNINLSDVLFTSASKSSELAEVGTGSVDTNTWKFTLRDFSKAVGVTAGKRVTKCGNTVTVPYTYTGSDVNQISVMITDKAYADENGVADGTTKILYYGKLNTTLNDAVKTGTGTFTMPEGSLESAKIYLLAENVNTDNKDTVDTNEAMFTDTASAPVLLDNIMLIEEIESVAVTDITAPQGGSAFDTIGICETAGVSGISVKWTDVNGQEVNGNALYAPVKYKAEVTLTADNSHIFTEQTVIGTADGQLPYESIILNANGTVTLVTEEILSSREKLSGIQQNRIHSVSSGVLLRDMGLPSKVAVTTDGQITTEAEVDWHFDSPVYLDGTGFDIGNLTGYSFVLEGDVILPAHVDSNGVELKTRITVAVSGADKVSAPVVDLVENTYTENQTVEIFTTTAGASVYYTMTTDGSEPAEPTKDSTLYTGKIDLTGTAGTSVVIKIKAVAVKEAMQDSEVSTFTYTINLPAPKYTVMVTGGTGSGEYKAGQSVMITAAVPEPGKRFKEWAGAEGLIFISGTDKTSATARFTMPANAVAVTAVYEDIPFVGEAPVIIGQPADVLTEIGATATFAVKATGTEALTYQWLVNRNDGNGFVNLSGATGSTYTVPVVDEKYSGFQYRCVVTNEWGSAESNAALLTVTQETAPEEVVYGIIDGANQMIREDYEGTVTIACDGALSKFVSVAVDGKTVDSKFYMVKSGSTILTVMNDYLGFLSLGKHTIRFQYTDGYAETNLLIEEANTDCITKPTIQKPTIQKPAAEEINKPETPNTGERVPVLWLFVALASSAAGIIISVVRHRKKEMEE